MAAPRPPERVGSSLVHAIPMPPFGRDRRGTSIGKDSRLRGSPTWNRAGIDKSTREPESWQT